MSLVGVILSDLLTVFLLVLIFRLVMEWVFMLSQTYRPTGFMSVVLEITYTITDPPLRALRRVIPPLPIGRMSLDLSFYVLFLVVVILRQIVSTI